MKSPKELQSYFKSHQLQINDANIDSYQLHFQRQANILQPKFLCMLDIC